MERLGQHTHTHWNKALPTRHGALNKKPRPLPWLCFVALPPSGDSKSDGGANNGTPSHDSTRGPIRCLPGASPSVGMALMEDVKIARTSCEPHDGRRSDAKRCQLLPGETAGAAVGGRNFAPEAAAGPRAAD